MSKTSLSPEYRSFSTNRSNAVLLCASHGIIHCVFCNYLFLLSPFGASRGLCFVLVAFSGYTHLFLSEHVKENAPVFCPLCLFVLRFYGPVNTMGSCRARSVYLTTRLLGRLSPLSG